MSTLPLAVRRVFVVVVMVSAMCPGAHAALSVIGDVTPFDNFFTGTFEGITPSEINTEEPVNEQTGYEKNEDIVVGVKLMQGGRMDIDGSTQVRYQNLIIGSKGLQNGIERTGTGTVLITGNGAMYSNDPTSLPPELEAIGFASDGSVARDPEEGFDLIVGEYGQGRLELISGGRAEIQDAVIVGQFAGSTGIITVDGFGTLLGSGGFEASAVVGEAHQMIIGQLGTGQMYITNGGLVVTEAPLGGTEDVVGAVIGGDAFEQATIPELGGTGEVTLSGVGSRWVIGGSLQIGGYHDVFVGVLQDSSGVNAIYNSADGQPGRGTLIVETGALVKVRYPLGVTDDTEDLLMAIGRFGTVDLRGGLIDMGDGTEDGDSTPNQVQVINDGLITGYGRIQTGSFNNRYYGQVRIGAGESLIVDSKGEFSTVGIGDVYPLANFGLIEVVGTEDQRAELEFVRPPAGPGNPLTPFINLLADTSTLPTPDPFDGGLISAQHATLRFGSGIQNQGSMIFTAGVNQVSGRVDNVTGALDRNALVYIGPDTTVVADNDFSSGGFTTDADPTIAPPILSLQRGSTLVVEGNLTLAGFLDMELSFTNPSTIQVAGDLGVNATLFASFDSEAMSSLSHGDAFELMYFARDVGGVDDADPTRLIPDLATNSVLNVATDANFDAQFPTLDLIALPILQSYYLFVLDPTQVGVGAMGADFNGDGVVDALDLAIWNLNKGLSTNASVLQGDADGDGDVDGADYLIWLERFTNGGVPGGSPQPAGSVPEPAGIAMLSLGAMLALAFRRRRG